MYNLKHLFRIQKSLKKAKYPNSSRISKEISRFIRTEKQLDKVLAMVETGKPWEYIHGQADFYTFAFKINQNVLIPRIETEQVVGLAITQYKATPFDTVIDVGTGSGCIIISFTKSLQLHSIYKGNINKTEFFATDISTKAIKIAKSNIESYGLSKIIKLKTCNLIEDIDIKDRSVLILANLPYIPTEQYKNLDKSVKRFEPKIALDGGIDGNRYYKELLGQIKKSKCKNFTLILETEESIVKETEELFKKYKTSIEKDIYEKDRFVIVKG